jgi:aryl-alcohol dehydrogenase-like predicted oxidoreductase
MEMMEKKKFGTTDMQVSVLGFGSAEIGMSSVKITDKEVKLLLNTALEQGINVIDTASSYQSSEALIGQAVANRRREYYLFSKCGEGQSVGLPYPDWDARNVRPSVERSLKDLQTEYLDLILIHSCSEAVLRQGELIEAVQKLKDDGLVHYIGYSGDSTDALYAIKTGRFDALETSLNIADQEAVTLTLDEAAKRQMGIIAKRPLANVVWRRQGLENAPDRYVERLNRLDYPFYNEEPDVIVEKALRFVLSFPQVCTAIAGTTSPEHLLFNVVSASNGKLPDEEVRQIRERWQRIREPAWAGLT